MRLTMSFEAMDSAVQRIRSTWNTLESSYSQVQSTVTRVKGSWSSSDVDAYLACQQQWNTSARPLHDELNSLADYVASKKQAMQAAKAEVIRSWSV